MKTQPDKIQTRNERTFNFTAHTKVFGDVPVSVRVFEQQIYAPAHAAGWTWIWKSESFAEIGGEQVPVQFDGHQTDFVKSKQVPGYEGTEVALRCNTIAAKDYMMSIARQRRKQYAREMADWRQQEELDNL